MVPYTDLSGKNVERAHFRLEYQRTGAWIRDDRDHAWLLTEITYEVEGLTPLQ